MNFKSRDGEDIFAIKFTVGKLPSVFDFISMQDNWCFTDIEYTYNPVDRIYKFFSATGKKECSPKFIAINEWLVYSQINGFGSINILSEYEFNLRYNSGETLKELPLTAISAP